MTHPRPIVVGITGASGAPYAKRLLEVLLAGGHETHVVLSPSALQVFQAELGITLSAERLSLEPVVGLEAKRLRLWNHLNLSAGIASGSFRTAGMVICPCSMSTLATIAHGQGTNLIHRAAEVHLKERRKLILVPRETPLSLVGIENMGAVTRAGAIVLPAMPGFYHQPESIQDLVDFVVSRICDQLEIDNTLIRRWGTKNPST